MAGRLEGDCGGWETRPEVALVQPAQHSYLFCVFTDTAVDSV